MLIKKPFVVVFQLWLSAITLIFCQLSYAEEPSPNANAPIVKDEFNWQIMLDLSVAYNPSFLTGVKQNDILDYLGLGLLLDISYKGFFLQTNQRRSIAILQGNELGYQLVVRENWQFDILIKNYMQGYKPAQLIKYNDESIPTLEGLSDRNYGGGIALRYSHFFDNAIFTIDFANVHVDEDAQGDDIEGLVIDSFYSYLLPYRNWDIYLGAGLTYYDTNLVDYYIGVNADEVSNVRPLYSADSGFEGTLEIYAQYPLSQSWSFNTGITYSFYENSIKKSPLIEKNKLVQVMLGVLYVF